MTTAQASTMTRFVSCFSVESHFISMCCSLMALNTFSLLQASQLYYDANTGIYYYYDAESGRYQFHSKIDVPAAQTTAETFQDKVTAEKRGKKFKRGIKKTAQQDDKVC